MSSIYEKTTEESGATTEEWERLINLFIFDEVDRVILKRKLLDNVSVEQISEEIDFSVSQTKRRLSKSFNKLIKKI